jgi:hypothetical protein
MNFNNIRKQISEFRERLSAFIDTLPAHAEGVTPLNKKGTCGIVSFSTIGKNNGILCADYYLNHTAKKEMQRIIKNTKLESLDKVIEEIIQTGRIPGRFCKLNPQFIAKLKEMWESENDTKND